MTVNVSTTPSPGLPSHSCGGHHAVPSRVEEQNVYSKSLSPVVLPYPSPLSTPTLKEKKQNYNRRVIYECLLHRRSLVGCVWTVNYRALRLISLT